LGIEKKKRQECFELSKRKVLERTRGRIFLFFKGGLRGGSPGGGIFFQDLGGWMISQSGHQKKLDKMK